MPWQTSWGLTTRSGVSNLVCISVYYSSSNTQTGGNSDDDIVVFIMAKEKHISPRRYMKENPRNSFDK